jgi:WD40 repeat protein
MRMRGIGSRLAVLLALCLLTPSTQAAADANPHIVLQTRDAAVEVAAWTPDDKYLLTASGVGHNVTIWDVANRRVIDRAALPADPAGWGGDMLRIDAIDMSPDGTFAIVRGISMDNAHGVTPRTRDYRIDLSSRAVQIVTGRPLPPGTKGIEAYSERMSALSTIYEAATYMSDGQAIAALPKLPRSHDGRFGMSRAQDALELTAGGQTIRLTGSDRLGIQDAALSADGRILAMVAEPGEAVAGQQSYETTLMRFNVATGSFLPPIRLNDAYGFVRWLDANRLLVTSDAMAEDRIDADEDSKKPIAPGLVIDASSGAILQSLSGRCYITPIRDGFLGADFDNCRNGAAKGHKLQGAIAGKPWQVLTDFEEYAINGIVSSDNGRLVAITGQLANGRTEVVVMDLDKDEAVDSLTFPKSGPSQINAVKFIEGDKSLLVVANGGAQIWKFGTTETPRIIDARTGAPQMVATDGRIALISGVVDDAVARVSLLDGKALPPLDFGRVIAGGFIAGKPIFWAVSQFEGLRFWDTRDWHVLMTSVALENDHYVTVTPEGRYDTDLGPDADAFRWIVPDAPFQSLPAQTFMRDYFTPRLAQKLLDCTGAGTCAQVLPPLPSVATLNRVLPVVKITAIEPNSPGYVTVGVEVREGIDPAAANGKTRSGVYNVRLFRNGQLTDQMPVRLAEGVHEDLKGWRQSTAVEPGPDGSWSYPFVVPLPSGPDVGTQVFTAYAYNEDRVKSETAQVTFKPAPTPARLRRAYIVTVGIDDYDEARLKLRFSTADAKLIGERLAAMPGYEVRRLDLTTAPGADGKPRRVTTDTIRAAFRALTAGPAELDDMAADLKGFDISRVDKVTPDDLVIISWSGHGWADPQGDFFLLTSDARWPAGGKPEFGKMVSASDMTGWLRDVRAGEMAFIIDACHSGASVDSANFKPGPMGDPGLGQLAYDKGMRILAATQASDVAIEDARVGQGLLTYALAGEGVTASGGRADLNKDGRITLDEWLRYAVQRLPSLSADVKLGKVASARGFDLGSQRAVVKAQEPALFDFNNKPSPVVLRTGVK